MLIFEKEIEIPRNQGTPSLLSHIESSVTSELRDGEIPVRIAVTESDESKIKCEFGVLSNHQKYPVSSSIFDFQKRQYENIDQFNAVLLVPTGIGAEVGGHSGDGGPLSRLLASVCDNLITHPNVVNAADINEAPDGG